MVPEAAALGRRPVPLGVRSAVLLSLLAAGVWAWWHLGLSFAGLLPRNSGLVSDFFASAFTPAWTPQGDSLVDDIPPVPVTALRAAWQTVVYAGAAMTLSIAVGLVLGCLAARSWWELQSTSGVGDGALTRRGQLCYRSLRALIAGMRSVHELLWAVLFLVAVGLTEVAAILAIAIPYGGTLAKIYSELLDEAPRDSALAIRAAGGGRLQVFVFGLMPRALPDMIAYTFYRFECALRSSAVLGFFGYSTLGLYLRQSFYSSYYDEVWTYLYTLIGLVLAFDAWSGSVRRRLVA